MARVANNEISNGYSDVLVVKHGDLTASSTTQTVTLAIPAGGIVRAVGFYLEEAFDGGSTSSLKIDVGDGSDADGFVDSADTIDVLFTATGANLSELDAGKVRIYVDMKRLIPEAA